MLKARLLESVCVVDQSGRAANLERNMSRGLPVCIDVPEHGGSLAIVGSGPSVSKYIEELHSWPGDIWAMNGAYDYLLSEGVTPHGFVAVDPLPQLIEYVQNPQRETTFYIASTCDPGVIEFLDGYNVKLWHAASEDHKYEGGGKVVYGGTTVATRAPFLAMAEGWRDVTMFGLDSSYSKEGPYCYRWGSYSTDIAETILPVIINGEGPFYTEVGLLKQVSQLGAMLQMFNRVKPMLRIKEEGLMGAFMRAPFLDETQIEMTTEESPDGTRTDADQARGDDRSDIRDRLRLGRGGETEAH